MKPAAFTYHSPATVEEALTVLAEVGDDGKVLAGGQSLVPILNMRLASPAHLVDINGVAGLDTLDVNGGVRIGALARQARVEADEGVRSACPVLGQALRLVAHPAIRNRGTVCGALAHADPAGELPAILLLLDGTVEVARAGAPTRSVAARDFIAGPMEAALEPDELVLAAHFPAVPAHSGTAFVEVSRRRGDFALCGVAAILTVDADDRITAARTVSISVNPVPLPVDVTDAVAGQRAAGADVAAAGRLVLSAVDPVADIHAGAEYRRELAAALTERALAEAAARAVAGRAR